MHFRLATSTHAPESEVVGKDSSMSVGCRASGVLCFREADQQQNECTESDDRHRPLGPAPSKVPAFTHFLVRCNNNRKDQKVSDILDNEGANQRASSEATSLHDDKNAHRLCSVFQEEDIANHLGA